MAKITNVAKSVGKNYYFYAALYCVGIIGILIITYFRYDVLDEALNFDNWHEVMLLLGTLLSLQILAYMFLQRITRSLAVCVAGIISIVIMIIYLISTNKASEVIIIVKAALSPVLAIFFIYSALSTMFSVWKKISGKS